MIRVVKQALALADSFGSPVLMKYNKQTPECFEEPLTRIVTPYALLLHKTNLGFWGFCQERAAMRWFRLDRIEGIDPLSPDTVLTHPQPPIDVMLVEALLGRVTSRDAMLRGRKWLAQARSNECWEGCGGDAHRVIHHTLCIKRKEP